MTRSTGKRQYLACQRCRHRKTRCDMTSIGEVGKPPCLDCFRTGNECTLTPSKRGGNFRRKNGTSLASSPSPPPMSRESESYSNSVRHDTTSTHVTSSADDLHEEPICAELKNPADALQILTKATAEDRERQNRRHMSVDYSTHPDKVSDIANSPYDGMHPSFAIFNSNTNPAEEIDGGLNEYELVTNGILDHTMVNQLIQRYKENYHPYLPLVPRYVLLPSNIDRVAKEESFLLTVILTIASKDESNLEVIHQHCWEYMRRQLLDVLLALPHTHRIGYVEGLLLLSDWVPYIQLERSNAFKSIKIDVTEDNTAWSLVGQAVRHAYLLRLDRATFKEEMFGESQDQVDRKVLVWAYIFIIDRQISVRMGQSFWSRGPSLSRNLRAKDFPSLQRRSNDEEDYAAVMQANLELTQLLHNSHDILYSSKSRTLAMIAMGDYSRYLDDFLKSLLMWHSAWEGHALSSKLKCTLSLMYEYLCLYVCAFSFQAVVSRNLAARRSSAAQALSKKGGKLSFFPRGLMASPDGRYIFEAIRAAKMMLKIMAKLDPGEYLRYMPSRFYLYGIYSGVFLYKAHIFGALTVEKEYQEIISLIKGFISALENAATGEQHIGHRYSRLLRRLWFPTIRTSTHGQNHQKKSTARGERITNSRSPPERQATLTAPNENNPAAMAMSDTSLDTSSINIDALPTGYPYLENDPFALVSQGYFSPTLPTSQPSRAGAVIGGISALEANFFNIDDMNVIPPFNDECPPW